MTLLQRLKHSDSSRRRSRPLFPEPPKLGRAERTYARQLQEVARQTGAFIAGDWKDPPSLMQMLTRYADAIEPWATHAAAQMLNEVDISDRAQWRSLGNYISRGMQRQLQTVNVGVPLRALLAAQVGLIKSIPIEAGERVHHITQEMLVTSGRANELADQIASSTTVTESRAVLIARTEVSRTASVLVEVRAIDVGSEAYVWETSKDHDVRLGHKNMQGHVCRWDTPPAVIENGRVMHFHAGRIWNCRCWCRPVLPS